VDAADVLAVWEASASRRAVGIPTLAREVGLGRGTVAQAVTMLDDHGVLSLDGSGRVRGRPSSWPPGEDTREEVAAACERQRAGQRQRRVQLERLLDGTGCRWQQLVGYFGETMAEPCGHCDECDAGRSQAAGADLGREVVHEVFGSGRVVADDGEVITVLFDDAGHRSLARRVVEEEGLLRAEPADGAAAPAGPAGVVPAHPGAAAAGKHP
jgi:ATP-dependent DNA helicase RecQ